MRRTLSAAAFVSAVILASSGTSHAQYNPGGPTGGNTAVTTRSEILAPSSLTPGIVRQQLRPATRVGVPAVARNRSYRSLVPMLGLLWRRGIL